MGWRGKLGGCQQKEASKSFHSALYHSNIKNKEGKERKSGTHGYMWKNSNMEEEMIKEILKQLTED